MEPTTKWVPWDAEPWPGGEYGGDVQVTDGYSVKFILCNDGGIPILLYQADEGRSLYAVTHLNIFGVTKQEGWEQEDGIARDSEGDPIIWLAIQSEFILCRDHKQPGDTEYASHIDDEDLDRFFGTREEADKAALALAKQYISDPDLGDRDIGWRGQWPVR